LPQLFEAYVTVAEGFLLKEKTAERLAKAVEELLEANRMSAEEVLKAMLGASIPPKQKKLAQVGYEGGFKAAFKKMPEPSEDMLNEGLSMLKALKSAPHKMRSLLKQRVKELPHAPGGPPRKLTTEEEKTACAEVAALRSEYENREAIKRVALKRGISERTMYRIWRRHHPKKTS
jgi:DNA-binding NarL/FixJ family response regulator